MQPIEVVWLLASRRDLATSQDRRLRERWPVPCGGLYVRPLHGRRGCSSLVGRSIPEMAPNPARRTCRRRGEWSPTIYKVQLHSVNRFAIYVLHAHCCQETPNAGGRYRSHKQMNPALASLPGHLACGIVLNLGKADDCSTGLGTR